ncbi:hypothetical protein DIPPA_70145 [Diplonema papillatum]|nr:hypothetical protein DIPPA_70145 [Diplonema papillatum]
MHTYAGTLARRIAHPASRWCTLSATSGNPAVTAAAGEKRAKLLVLCTRNSCRSQMAEGIVHKMLGDRFDVVSAGTDPARQVHPLAMQVCREIDVDISANLPKHVDDVVADFDNVISLCDQSRRDKPSWLKHNMLSFSFEDPSLVVGTDSERLTAFRSVRDGIVNEVVAHLREQCAKPQTSPLST